MKKIVLRSNLHAGLLVEQMLRIYFFPRIELQNICLILKHSNDFLTDHAGATLLDKVFAFVVDGIETMSEDMAPSMVNSFVAVLHSWLVKNHADGLSHLQMVKLAKGMSAQHVKQVKRVMIFARERGLEECMTKMKELLVLLLTASPRTIIYKEFFSFFREIFYYNKDMDNVDFALACDTLQVMDSILLASKRSVYKETLAIRGCSIGHVSLQDSF